MSDGSIRVSVGVDDKEAQKKLEQLRKDIEKTQAAIEKSEGKRSGIAKSLEDARAEAEQTAQAIKEINAEMSENQRYLSGVTGNIDVEEFNARTQAQKEMQYELAQQEAIYNKELATVQKLEGQEQEITRQIDEQTRKLEQVQGEAGGIEAAFARSSASVLPELRRQTEQFTASIHKGAASIIKWGFGIRSAIILVRKLKQAIIEAIKAYAEGDEETKNNINSLKAALKTLKTAWGAAFAPIFNAVVPAIKTVIGWLIKAANAVAQFTAILTGKSTYKQYSEDMDDWADSIEGVGGAAKEAKKYLTGLDEIQTYQDNAGGGGGGGGGGIIPYTEEDVDTQTGIGKIAEFVRENLESIMLIVDEFLFVIGVVLLCTGHPLLGLGLMIYAGYDGVTNIQENWGKITEQLSGEMGDWMLVVSGAMLALGVIMLIAGQIPIGLGMIAAGAGGIVLLHEANFDFKMWANRNLFNPIIQAYNEFLDTKFGKWLATVLGLEKASLLPEDISVEFKGALTDIIDQISPNKKVINGIKGTVADIGTTTHTSTSGKIHSGSSGSFAIDLDGSVTTVSDEIPDDKKKLQFSPTFGKTAAGDLKNDFITRWKNIAEKYRELPFVAKFSTTLGDLKNDFITRWKKISEGYRTLEFAPGFSKTAYETWEDFKTRWSNIPNKVAEFGLSIGTKVSELWQSFKTAWGIRTLGFTVTYTAPASDFQKAIVKAFGLAGWPRLSFAARGGIVDAATLIGNDLVAGEDGAEAIIPLERHTEWIKRVAEEIVNFIQPELFPARMPAMATGTQIPPRVLCTFEGYNLDDVIRRLDRLIEGEQRPINLSATVNAKVNGKTLFSEVVTQGKIAQASSGRNPFNL